MPSMHVHQFPHTLQVMAGNDTGIAMAHWVALQSHADCTLNLHISTGRLLMDVDALYALCPGED